MNGLGITDVPGIRVGHYTDCRATRPDAPSVLCEDGAVGGVDVRGSAPGTRETDLLSPTAMVDSVHAVLLSGGSAFGLAAATGVVEYPGGERQSASSSETSAYPSCPPRSFSTSASSVPTSDPAPMPDVSPAKTPRPIRCPRAASALGQAPPWASCWDATGA